MKGFLLKECEICGEEFTLTHGRQGMCPECRAAIQHNKGRNLPRQYSNPTNIEKYESEMKERYMARYKDNIVAIGYAERQIAKSLELAGKVRTEL